MISSLAVIKIFSIIGKSLPEPHGPMPPPFSPIVYRPYCNTPIAMGDQLQSYSVTAVSLTWCWRARGGRSSRQMNLSGEWWQAHWRHVVDCLSRNVNLIEFFCQSCLFCHFHLWKLNRVSMRQFSPELIANVIMLPRPLPCIKFGWGCWLVVVYSTVVVTSADLMQDVWGTGHWLRADGLAI